MALTDAVSDRSSWYLDGTPVMDEPNTAAHYVTGCNDCPCEYDGMSCQLTGRKLPEFEPDQKTPGWCPLRSGDITVRLAP